MKVVCLSLRSPCDAVSRSTSARFSSREARSYRRNGDQIAALKRGRWTHVFKSFLQIFHSLLLLTDRAVFDLRLCGESCELLHMFVELLLQGLQLAAFCKLPVPFLLHASSLFLSFCAFLLTFDDVGTSFLESGGLLDNSGVLLLDTMCSLHPVVRT